MKKAAMFVLSVINKRSHTEGRCPWVSRSQIFKNFKLTPLDCRAMLAMTRVQSAAMFGLDARIALAIFGALSVITGAALYSAISDAKVTSLLADLNEIGKAVEQYYLDTGTLPPRMNPSNMDGNEFYVIKCNFLAEDSGVAGWNGPYISHQNKDHYLLYKEDKRIVTFHLNDNGPLGNSDNWTAAKCSSGNTCSLWIRILNYSSDSLLKQLDEKVDGGDGLTSGSIKWVVEVVDADTTNYHLYYKYMPLDNPHD